MNARRVLSPDSRTESGASAVEYGLLVAAVAAVIVAIVLVLGGVVLDNYSQTCANIEGEMNTGASC